MSGGLSIGVLPWEPVASETFASIGAQAAHAESLGLHSLWLPELHFSEHAPWPSPLLSMAAAAACTSRLRLGTTSYLLPVRDPLQVAEDVAVLDRLSRGRIILGLGRGFQPSLFAAFGVPAREKRKRFEAHLHKIRRAWAGEPVAYAGEPIRLEPLPLQRPHPPLWVAAFGPKAIAQAARLGLPYLASPAESFERLEHNYGLHRAALADDVDPSSLSVPVMRSVFVTREPAAAKRVSEALRAQAEQMARAGRVGLDREGGHSTQRWALVGDPDGVEEAIARYREQIGMTHLIARVGVPRATAEEIRGSLEMLAELQV